MGYNGTVSLIYSQNEKKNCSQTCIHTPEIANISWCLDNLNMPNVNNIASHFSVNMDVIELIRNI